MKRCIGVLVGLLAILMNNVAYSDETKEQEKKSKNEEMKALAVQVQNPVSDLVQFGFTNTTLFGSGPANSNINAFNLLASTTRKFGQWALLNRLVVPIFYLPESVPDAPSGDSGKSVGLGDIEYTAFFARDESKRFFKTIGGIGPTIVFKTATDDRMGLGKWLIGPTLAIVRMPDPWVHGVVVRNLWSFAGDSDRLKVNLFLIQPFVNYNFTNGWYLTSTPGITANWKADSRNRWLVPIGGGVGKVMFRGDRHPVNVKLQSFYFIEKPDGGPDWSLQIQFRILFP